MNKIEFKDLPNTTTPFTADIFNEMQDNIEDAIDEVQSNLNTTNTYSTDEVDTGMKWIDDKPIYRKSITFTNPRNDGVTTIATLSNIDTFFVINDKSYIVGSNGIQYPLIRTHISNINLQADIRFDKQTGVLNIGCGSELNVSNGIITIEYTKTTD